MTEPSREERTMVSFAKRYEELGNDTRLSAELDMSTNEISLRYMSNYTQSLLAFPAMTITALVDFLTSLQDDPAVVTAIANSTPVPEEPTEPPIE